MNKKPLIGSGFYANPTTAQKANAFSVAWLVAVGTKRDIVIVDNADEACSNLDLIPMPNVRVIKIHNNLGHVGSHLGKHRPHMLGWSMSWILPALVAYSEQRDFIYVESDCLVFGDWESSIINEAKEHNFKAVFGKGVANIAPCEQSLFWIEWDFITEFVNRYLSFPEGDGLMLPEAKFAMMAKGDLRISTFSLGVGRDRPLPYDAPSWYAQHITDAEMQELKNRKLI